MKYIKDKGEQVLNSGAVLRKFHAFRGLNPTTSVGLKAMQEIVAICEEANIGVATIPSGFPNNEMVTYSFHVERAESVKIPIPEECWAFENPQPMPANTYLPEIEAALEKIDAVYSSFKQS